jgi:DNA polymerase III delta prime subunit
MPSINDCKKVATHIYRSSPRAVCMFHGKPGTGKSDAALQIADDLGVPEDRTLVVHINNHDVVDFTGVPSVNDGMTVFNPTKMFYDYREGSGAGLIVLEELAQSSQQLQTWAAGFVLERQTPMFKLDPEVRIIATGNRAEDRAGAKPLLGHLNDRLYHFDVETSLDDWCEWAMENGVDAMGIAFLRLRPNLLNDYDPNRRSNPTQRSWTKLFTEVPNDLPTNLYMTAAEGKVGEGAAAEWVAARDMMHKMPSIDAIRLHPADAEVPTEPAVKYAVATSLSMSATPESFSRDMTYVSRLPKDFQMVYVTDALRLKPELQQTQDFIQWAIANKDIFMGGE